MLDIRPHGPIGASGASGAIRELRLARPPANALDPGLIAALRDAVSTAPADGAAALVLSGSPGMFSAGLDVPHLLQLDRPAMRAAWQDFFALLHALAASPIPIAVAITGHSPAGGAVLSIFCDYRVMAEGPFRIGLNEVQVGIPLPELIYAGLRHVVGTRQAERLGVGGLMLDVAEALRVGLVDEVVALDQVVPRAVAWCEGMLALPPSAMAKTRRVARRELVTALSPGGRGGDDGGDKMLDRLVDDWFSAETQATLRRLVERLAARKRA